MNEKCIQILIAKSERIRSLKKLHKSQILKVVYILRKWCVKSLTAIYWIKMGSNGPMSDDNESSDSLKAEHCLMGRVTFSVSRKVLRYIDVDNHKLHPK
jgi:hypothetical protein